MPQPTLISRAALVNRLAADGHSLIDHAAAAILDGSSAYRDASGQLWRVAADHEQPIVQPAAAAPAPAPVAAPSTAKDLGDQVADILEARGGIGGA